MERGSNPELSKSALISRLRDAGDPDRAEHSLSFFKCGPGGYGEGDKFLGVRVPEQRRLARLFRELSLNDCEELLQNELHEVRLTALLILTEKMSRALKRRDEGDQQRIVSLYLRRTEWVNNWDLVDTSAPNILGPYLRVRNRGVLYDLAVSTSLWENRIAVLTTLHFVRQGEFEDAISLAEKLLYHPHDLMHKAVGWILREIGKRDRDRLERFLKEHRADMPRTALRYAIEHFSESERRAHMYPDRDSSTDAQ